MLKEDYRKLKRRDAIRVRFGSYGSQIAIVHGWSARNRDLLVFKYSAKRKRWTTKPVRVNAGEVIEKLVNEGELRHAPRLPPAYDHVSDWTTYRYW